MTGTDRRSGRTDTRPGPRAALVLGLLALAVVVPGLGLGQTPAKELVAEVYVVGNRTIPTEKVLAYVTNTRKNMEYSFARVQDDVIRLTNTHMFRNVRVRTDPTQDGRMNVIFEVTEHPKVVREVVYKNAQHVNDKDLESITRVRKGMPLDKTVNQLACYEIQEHLKKQGRYFANVTLEEGFDEQHDRVVFNITEGPKVRVRHVNFVGQQDLATAGRLRTQIDTSRSFLGLLGGTFNPAMIESDVAKLEEYYRSNGYLNVRVTREPFQWSPDYQYVDITYHIREGARYRVKDVSVEGSKRFPPEQLGSIVQVKKGEFYNEGVVSADVRNLTDYGGYRGQQLKVDKLVTSIPDEPGAVRVQYVVEEPQVPSKVGQVIIVGNTVTQDRVIRRVLGLYPGQTLRYPEVRMAERDLARLNIFKMKPDEGIRPTVTVLDSPSEYKDVLVQVQEDHTGSLMLGAGVNSNNGLVGSIVLNERNFDITRFPTSWADIYEGRAFRGAGQEFRLEAVPGTQLQRYTATFREPFLFDRPYSLTTSAYYYSRIFNEYTEARAGGRATIGHQLNKAWTLNAGLRIENIDVRDVPAYAPPDYLSVIGNNFLIAPRIGATWDTRDSMLRPTEGGMVDASYEQAFGSFTFPLVNIEASRYFTTWQRPDGSGKHVIALHSQVGFAGDNTPVYERFFAGGFRSIRGFQFRGVGPNVNGFMVGGDFMFLNSIEYQIPILANDQLYAVAFLDSGTVEKHVGITDYRVSAGVGLRITVPALGPVPIALDFGFPINRTGSDQEQIFAFWFGMYR